MFSTAVFILMGYAHIAIPDEITAVKKMSLSTSSIFSLTQSDSVAASGTKESEKSYEVNVSLFKIIPLRKTRVYDLKRRYVAVGGDVLGIKLYSNGVLVISTEDIETENGSQNPGKKAGIKSGDIIKKIDGEKVSLNSDVSRICKKSGGKELLFTIERNGEIKTLKLKTVKEISSGDFKAGLWVRDSTAGIGTITFTERESGVFASLGHAICDIDTGLVVPLSEGEALEAEIIGCTRGTKEEAGELTGVFRQNEIGVLYKNSPCGVYGVLTSPIENEYVLPVATRAEVKVGKAQILCSVNQEGKKFYDVEITRILDMKSAQKNMTVKITDSDLLEITGGIVQGMSGTPLIQNGMLVGAITHVFVGNSQEGYAIFAENMLEAADEVKAAVQGKKAS